MKVIDKVTNQICTTIPGCASGNDQRMMENQTVATKSKVIQPGGLNKRLISTIKAAVKSSATAHTCDWLVIEGYASDAAHARELVNSALNA